MDDDKLDALVHYVCAKCADPEKLGATKLNKILWFADVFAFARYGQSVTGATYIKRQFGPVPLRINAARSRLRDRGAIVERQVMVGSFMQTQLISMLSPNISIFSSEEVSLIDDVIHSVVNDHTAKSISDLSHNLVWESAAIGEQIPIAAGAFGGNIGEIDEDDMAWARNEIDRIEGNVASSGI